MSPRVEAGAEPRRGPAAWGAWIVGRAFTLRGGGSVTPTSVIGTEAVREHVEQEGSFCGGELRGSLWAAIWECP